MRDVQPKPGMQIANPRWSPDGKTIIFIGGLMSDEPIPGGDVYATDATPGPMKNPTKDSMRNLTPDSKSTATSLTWLPNSQGILVTGIDAGETFVARLTLTGAIDSRLEGSGNSRPRRIRPVRISCERWHHDRGRARDLLQRLPRFGPAQWETGSRSRT